jgi:ribosome modulation factor
MAGYDARLQNKSADKCPYTEKDLIKMHVWLQGYLHAMMESEHC